MALGMGRSSMRIPLLDRPKAAVGGDVTRHWERLINPATMTSEAVALLGVYGHPRLRDDDTEDLRSKPIWSAGKKPAPAAGREARRSEP